MVQIFTLRERLAALPGAVRRRAEAVGVRASAVADARAVVPEIPRDAEAGHLERAARRLLRRAAQDEFAREGVTRVPLPEATGRADLRRADVPGEASFRAFVEDLLSAVDIRPSLLERDDAVDLRDARGSADAYGISPEVASDLASYLLGRAFAMHREAGTGPGAASAARGAADSADLLESYLEEQAALIREDVREALVRQVRVPLELQVARERHERIEALGPGAGFAPVADGAGADAADLPRRARAAFEHAQNEAGRAAFGVLRTGAARMYGRYGHPRTPPSPPSPR
ncbi:MAG TPA: hypothetical protein H9932_13925 [Candidatus Brachybacterium intestinipullorum]|uniref:Uncharacterized protein n=1 Tax=Candidatus Brachybacterium intestinipullorum TaxID=2838512 RepID=A0A9D2Q3F7_9MICO|nr:hypothetical protein [Candidatus Brachybacterium intestinipullorum]